MKTFKVELFKRGYTITKAQAGAAYMERRQDAEYVQKKCMAGTNKPSDWGTVKEGYILPTDMFLIWEAKEPEFNAWGEYAP